MYIFAKFVADHIFLQNHDKINIKKIRFFWVGRLVRWVMSRLGLSPGEHSMGGKLNVRPYRGHDPTNIYTLHPIKSVARKPCLSHKHASRTTLFVERSSMYDEVCIGFFLYLNFFDFMKINCRIQHWQN
jgi:hypothetical protein